MTTKLKLLIGDRTANAFQKHLGLSTAEDLLTYFPRRYASRGELTPFESLPVGDLVTVVGEVRSVRVRALKGRSGSILEVQLSDGDSNLELAFFNQPWRQKELYPGVRGLFSGKVTSFGSKVQLTHPDYELFEELPAEMAKAWSERPIPIYKASGPVSTWKIQKAVDLVLDQVFLEDPYPQLQSLGYLDYQQAVVQIHRPTRQTEIGPAVERLKLHEAITLRLRLNLNRESNNALPATTRAPGKLLERFDKELGFELTKGQQQACGEIFEDLSKPFPMNRLIQGEVGSGKTLVAIRAMLAAAESGGQTAFLAPTEVLAFQHFRGISEQLGKLSAELGVEFLSGNLPAKQRSQIELNVASGKTKFVIGTHALLSDSLVFRDLALVVIDEQHRFGVEQREKLRRKSDRNPHVLAMTATPIPRTVAVSVFGDLQISSLRELPAGRKPIQSHIVSVSDSGLVARVWERVAEEITRGRQAFVVCPMISKTEFEASDSEDQLPELSAGVEPANVTDVAEALSLNPALLDVRIGLVHGKLEPNQKAEAMQRFSHGQIDILVATTVIEVGVNVPNASVMVVLDADRFGIAQLHQLRGRVGRGEYAGLFIMLTGSELFSHSMQRLEAVAGSTNGFELSELDLQLRGEGDVLGKLQSGGKSGLKLLRAIQDAQLIEGAVELADQMFEEGLSDLQMRVVKSLGDIGLDQS